MRELLSKCVAGGLSAGVVLLWWPVLFEETDTVTSWFVRGVAWTVCFELVLVAVVPFERALWETGRGQRLSRRMGNAGSRLHTGSRRRRLSRLSAIAAAAVALPAALLLMGLHEQAPASAETKRVSVVRVTEVVRPVTVTKVMPDAQAAIPSTYDAPASEPAAPAPLRITKKPENGRTVVPRVAPVEEQVEPSAGVLETCDGPDCTSSTSPASGSAL